MNWNHAKNIVLWMLLGLNLLLLGYLSVLLISRENSFREAAEGAIQVLEKHGISCDLSLVKNEPDNRRLCVIERDTAREKQAAEALLGTVEFSDNGSIDHYRHGDSFLSWAPGGNLEGTLPYSPETFCARLNDMGITLREDTAAQDFVQTIDDLPVFNVRLALTETESLALSGRCLAGTPIPADEKAPMSVTSILIEYAKCVSGQAVARITAIDRGWIAQTLPGIGIRLVPVYRITADALILYLNALDGTSILSE